MIDPVHPIARSRPFTFGAAPVLAGVVGDVVVAAFGATRHMPAERLGSAGLDGRHHLELGQADMPLMGLPPRTTMGAEDVSQLQLGPGHTGAESLQTSLDGAVLQLRQHLVGADRVADRLLVLGDQQTSDRSFRHCPIFR